MEKAKQQEFEQQDVPIIDLKTYFDRGEGWEEECKKVAASLH